MMAGRSPGHYESGAALVCLLIVLERFLPHQAQRRRCERSEAIQVSAEPSLFGWHTISARWIASLRSQ
jgi:hypothetical protein